MAKREQLGHISFKLLIKPKTSAVQGPLHKKIVWHAAAAAAAAAAAGAREKENAQPACNLLQLYLSENDLTLAL